VQGGLAAGDGWGVALSVALLVNAFLTLVAGSRLWSHIFWRPGPDGAMAELANPALKPLSRRQVWYGLAPTAVLAAGVVALGLLPEPLVAFGRAAAGDFIDPAGYVDATGLAEAGP
jgi:multicomponent Na+:H+ antiporter subunit D